MFSLLVFNSLIFETDRKTLHKNIILGMDFTELTAGLRGR